MSKPTRAGDAEAHVRDAIMDAVEAIGEQHGMTRICFLAQLGDRLVVVPWARERRGSVLEG